MLEPIVAQGSDVGAEGENGGAEELGTLKITQMESMPRALESGCVGSDGSILVVAGGLDGATGEAVDDVVMLTGLTEQWREV